MAMDYFKISLLFFQALADKLGDDKGLTEHLKLPIQRINDYQLLLKVKLTLSFYYIVFIINSDDKLFIALSIFILLTLPKILMQFLKVASYVC